MYGMIVQNTYNSHDNMTELYFEDNDIEGYYLKNWSLASML